MRWVLGLVLALVASPVWALPEASATDQVPTQKSNCRCCPEAAQSKGGWGCARAGKAANNRATEKNDKERMGYLLPSRVTNSVESTDRLFQSAQYRSGQEHEHPKQLMGASFSPAA